MWFVLPAGLPEFNRFRSPVNPSRFARLSWSLEFLQALFNTPFFVAVICFTDRDQSRLLVYINNFLVAGFTSFWIQKVCSAHT